MSAIWTVFVAVLSGSIATDTGRECDVDIAYAGVAQIIFACVTVTTSQIFLLSVTLTKAFSWPNPLPAIVMCVPPWTDPELGVTLFTTKLTVMVVLVMVGYP
jgi:hypothetical protein